MQKKNPNGRFNIEFIKMITTKMDSGELVKDLCNDYDLNEKTVYAWHNKHGKVKLNGNASTAPVDISSDELEELRRELKKANSEIEVLKKCITIFSRT